MRKVRKIIKKQFSPTGVALRGYRRKWENSALDEAQVLLEPQQGRSLDGNVFYIVKELLNNSAYGNFRIAIVHDVNRREEFRQKLDKHELSAYELVERHSPRYVELLTTSSYLVTDTGFPTYFIKKPGQKILNTWHGTPLKAMGRSDKAGRHDLGNIQRNLALADYLLFPSDYMLEHMTNDYMLDAMSDGVYLLSGYPRNEVFFDQELSLAIRSEIAPDAERVYAYMPTWRETLNNYPRRYRSCEVISILIQLDMRLNDNERLFVNLHPLQRSGIDFSCFKHIEEFPHEYEIYEVLAACDALVTDYSSVMFDYAIRGKNIVLFDYDKDIYLSNRGMYIDLEKLPFPRAQHVTDLLRLLRDGEVPAREGFLNEFCPFEALDASVRLCEYVFKAKPCLEERRPRKNEKKNILIFAGNLARNGITSSLLNYLRSPLVDKYNFYLTFDSNGVKKNKDILDEIPQDVVLVPCKGKSAMTLFEKFAQSLYAKKRIGFPLFDRFLNDTYRLNIARYYASPRYDAVIQFNGYDYKKIYQFSKFDTRKIIFVHSDMVNEARVKGNQRLDLLEYAYKSYDRVAVVSEDIMPITQSISGGEGRFSVVNNLFDYHRVKSLAKQEVSFNEATQSNVSLIQLKDMLSSDGKTIVSIGRYSLEKQHDILIKAFNDLWLEDNSIRLIIIGGGSYADLYDSTVGLVDDLPCHQAIACIKNMSNPYAVLAKADGFILPSKYEGFGMVLLEADALNVPVVATDIPGPRGIVSEHGGALVENSFEGIKGGLCMLLNGEAPCLQVDFEAYNLRSLRAFEELIEGD